MKRMFLFVVKFLGYIVFIKNLLILQVRHAHTHTQTHINSENLSSTHMVDIIKTSGGFTHIYYNKSNHFKFMDHLPPPSLQIPIISSSKLMGGRGRHSNQAPTAPIKLVILIYRGM